VTTTVCTIVTRRTMSRARRLHQTITLNSPGTRVIALLLDDREFAVDDAAESVELVRPDELEIERFDLLAARLSEGRLIRATQPALVRKALERAAGAPVVFLDSQTEVFGDLAEFAQLAKRHGIALVARLREPIPRDALRPTETDVLEAGMFDPGCVAFGAGPRTNRLLQLWTERLRYAAHDEESIAFSRWHDLLATLMPDAKVTADPGLGVSVWNLHERRLEEDDGRISANGRPLRTLCFTGLEVVPDGLAEVASGEPEWPAHALTRSDAFLQRSGLLGRLSAERGAGLLAQSRPQEREAGPGFAQLADGTALTPWLRKWIQVAERHGGLRSSPFTSQGTNELLDWLRAPTERGNTHQIPRLWLFVYAQRSDLQSTFPDVDGSDERRFAAWIRDHGEREYDLPAALRLSNGDGRTG
jgi:hypothetical protein